MSFALSYLGPAQTDWLLGEDNPSVRFFALTDILDRSPRGRTAVQAKRAIMARGPVPEILRRQNPDGGWAPAHRLYTSKYWGTVWTLIVLAELGADPNDGRIRKACDHILEHSWSPASGGFSTHPSKQGGGLESSVIPCLTGNMVFALVRLGRAEDSRVRRAVEWLTRNLRFDDSGSQPVVPNRFQHHDYCYGRHSCLHGVVKGLKGLAALPVDLHSPAVKRTIRRGVGFMLLHQVYRSSHHPSRIARPGWASFGFPNMWNTDALEILDILTRLRVKDHRMLRAVDLLKKKQDSGGRWNLGHTWNGSMLVDIERKGRPSKWITLSALRVLKRSLPVLRQDGSTRSTDSSW
ncbi:MAG: terpene cyclase/mutase family protein [candidate division WOR-3 bacterium]|nr:MAG: terpene cyclase/mutase family protein [candidate division WOR-3 bacterium]